MALTLFLKTSHIFLMQIYFGLNVKHLREARNIDRESFARHFNLHLSSVSHWERGKHLPKVEDVIAVAHFFDVTVDDLLLRDLASGQSSVQEKSEPYLPIGEKNSQAIEVLRLRLLDVEARLIRLESGLSGGKS
jgi:transcriptional regulator with XRE-family HTH domain